MDQSGVVKFSRVMCRVLIGALALNALGILYSLSQFVWPYMTGTGNWIILHWLGPFSFFLRYSEGTMLWVPSNQSNWFVQVLLSGDGLSLPDAAVLQWGLIGIMALLAFGVSVAVLWYLRRVFVELRDGLSPFCEAMVGRVKWLAMLVTFYMAVTFDLGGLLLALVIWLLYFIFKHGCMLQDESDTTL